MRGGRPRGRPKFGWMEGEEESGGAGCVSGASKSESERQERVEEVCKCMKLGTRRIEPAFQRYIGVGKGTHTGCIPHPLFT